MSKITYANKVALNIEPDIADINKVKDTDMNEIKQVVNENDDNVGDLTSLTTEVKSSIVGAINEIFGNLQHTPVTISGFPSGTTYSCFYIPILKICFMTAYINSQSMSAGSVTTLGTVPSDYLPSGVTALSFYKGTSGEYQAIVRTDGLIRFFTENSIASGSKFTISGVWHVGGTQNIN